MKTHFSPAASAKFGACGKQVAGPRYVTTSASSVTCLNCKKQPEFTAWQERQEADAHKAFMAQEPKVHKSQFSSRADNKVVCSKCEGELFRYKGRSKYGHDEIYVCANVECGHHEYRMTETGMSF